MTTSVRWLLFWIFKSKNGRPDEEEGLYIFEFLKILNETVKILDKKVEELKYLQHHYKIIKKD